MNTEMRGKKKNEEKKKEDIAERGKQKKRRGREIRMMGRVLNQEEGF